MVGCEAPVSLDDSLLRNAGGPLEAVDVLGEGFQQDALLVQQPDEAVRDRGLILSGIELVSEGEERQWVLAEEGYVEDGFGVRQIQPGQVCIESSLR